MTVEELKAKLQLMQAKADDEEVRTAVQHMLYAVELDNEWTEDELKEYWKEIEAVEQQLATANLLERLSTQLN